MIARASTFTDFDHHPGIYHVTLHVRRSSSSIEIACFPQALTAYQAGILLVECFPYIPDLIMLMRELAISQSAPSSHELLTKGAMRYAEKQGPTDIEVRPVFL